MRKFHDCAGLAWDLFSESHNFGTTVVTWTALPVIMATAQHILTTPVAKSTSLNDLVNIANQNYMYSRDVRHDTQSISKHTHTKRPQSK